MSGRLKAFLAVGAVWAAVGCDGEEATKDAGQVDGAVQCQPRDAEQMPDREGCEPLASDYAPCQDDRWEPCVSDDGEYHRIQDTISTIARINAFERIAGLLFDPGQEPDGQDFLAARLIYQEDEGLDSRVVRRYDPHYPAPEQGGCQDQGVPEAYPDYCLGPARLQPLLLEAFNAGIDGVQPRVQAARIEAALLWFLHVSTYKESLTCTDTARDCDSAYAYYTGGESARGGLGLARYIKGIDPLAHDRAWDGLLAVRCWRDLDDGDTAEDLELRDRARSQYDRALLDGVAAIGRDRLQQGGEGDWAFVRTLGLALDREARERSEVEAAVLREEMAKSDLNDVDVQAIVSAIDAVFDCP